MWPEFPTKDNEVLITQKHKTKQNEHTVPLNPVLVSSKHILKGSKERDSFGQDTINGLKERYLIGQDTTCKSK